MQNGFLLHNATEIVFISEKKIVKRKTQSILSYI